MMSTAIKDKPLRAIAIDEGAAGTTRGALDMFDHKVRRLWRSVIRDAGRHHRITANDVATSLNHIKED